MSALREDDLIFGKPDGRNPRSGTKLLSYRIGMRISSSNSKEKRGILRKSERGLDLTYELLGETVL